MIQAAITFASVILAASIAYLAALTAWRRQQRREVYGAFIASVDDVLDSLDLLLAGNADADGRLCDLDRWEQFRQARLKFDAAWGQVRLVAPTDLAEHARRTGYALLNFERDANDLTVEQARKLRKGSPFLSWDQAKAFVAAARRDLRVESRWRRRDVSEGSDAEYRCNGA